MAKWQKLLGVHLEEIKVSFRAEGAEVSLVPIEGSPCFKGRNAQGTAVPISPAEYSAAMKAHNAPSEGDALRAFRNKYELRLNKAFPANPPASGSEADISVWLQNQPFNDRRALLLSKKAFEKAYPNGHV